MDTEFVELQVENFGPFVGKHTLPLGTQGVTFVKGRNKAEPRLGPNGAGKSKLLNALPWCLYGRTTDDLASTDIRPWTSKGQTRVRVRLIAWESEEGVRHTITRTAGPNSLMLDGKPCAQADIERLVGWSLPVFRQAVFLGQGQPLFHDLPNREKLDFLVDVLGLSRWDKYAERAAAQTAELERQLARVIGEFDGNAMRIEELAVQVKRQQAEADSWESWRTGRLGEVEKQVRKLIKQVGTLETHHAGINVKLDGAETELKLVQGDEARYAKKAADADVAYRTAKANQLTAKQRQEETAAELAALMVDARCPTCGNKITRESTLISNRERLQKAIANFAVQASSATVNEALGKLEKARATAENWRAQAQALLVKVEALVAEERLARRNLGDAQLELRGAKRQLGELESGANPHRPRLADLRKAYKAAVADGEAMAKERAQLEASAVRTKYWIKGFKDVRLFVLEDVLDELEFTTNSMLDAMGLVGWEVRYNVERETKSGTTQRGLITTVLNPDKAAEAKWKSWSGGEGQRLRIAGALALSQVLLGRAGVECNLEVLDEPTRHLSDEGVEDLCDFLSERAYATGKGIFLVDHKAIESSRFARVVTVIKDANGSRIEL